MSGMKNGMIAGCVILAFAFTFAGLSSGEIPHKINYQGRLTDGDTGEPVPGTHNMTFRIYDDPATGSLLWSESQTLQADSSGVFSAVLGTNSAIDLSFESPVWLEVEVAGEVLSPRREIVSVAFAFRAEEADRAADADSLAGYAGGDFVRTGQTSIITSEMIIDGTGSDLDADMVDGLHADAFADTGHAHDDRYYTQALLNTPGTINSIPNPVDWTKLKGVPAGLADGVDDVGEAGDGHSLDAADGAPVDAVYVDNEGNVGIGILTPSERLHLRGGTSGILVEASTADPEIILGGTGDTSSEQWRIYKDRGQGDLRFAQDGDRLRIRMGTGNVSIGSGIASERLDVDGSINLSGHLKVDGSTVLSVDGTANTFVGDGAGANSTGPSVLMNTFVGEDAGNMNSEGDGNTFVGAAAGQSNDEGGNNTFLGVSAGTKSTDGDYNTFVGAGAGGLFESGSRNTYVGTNAGDFSASGDRNTFIGMYSGTGNEGSGNVFIGNEAGNGETGSNKLYIANGSNPGDVLIYGDFSTGRLGFGNLNPDVRLDVSGDINADSLYLIGGTRVLSTSGPKNLSVGRGANMVNGGRKVTCVGDSAGFVNNGPHNTFVGSLAGRSSSSGSGNTFVGAAAGYGTTSGDLNTFVGEGAGYDNQTGNSNTFVGKSAGYNNNGENNTFVGLYAGLDNDSGYNNIFVGGSAGLSNISGMGNTYIGRSAGGGNETGSRNVCIGYSAGYYETGSDKLIIANGSGDEDILIYGDFANRRIGLGTKSPDRDLHIVGANPRLLIEASSINPEINLKHSGDASSEVWAIYKEGTTNDLRFYQGGDQIIVRGTTGNVGIGGDPMGTKFYVNGSACGTSGFGTCSDLRFKRDIEDIGDAVDKVMNLRGVSFLWRTDEHEDRNFDSGRHFGVIAQETEEVLPEVVMEVDSGEKAVAYSEFIPVLIEAIKTQQDEIETLKERLADLESRADLH
jgi:hypothetical protein